MQPLPPDTPRVEFVPDNNTSDASIDVPNVPFVAAKGEAREATPTVLMDAGFTGTQLIENKVAREATKTQLLEGGYTVSQLQDAGILPPSKQIRKAIRKQETKKPGFKSKPLKFDSKASSQEVIVRRARKPTVKEKDVVADADHRKRSPPEATGMFEDEAAKADKPPARKRTRVPSEDLSAKRQGRERDSPAPDESPVKKRTMIKDSTEDVRPSPQKNGPTAKPLDLTTLLPGF